MATSLARERYAGMTVASILRYWSHIEYQLGDDQRRGLELFYRKGARWGLWKSQPALRFLGSDSSP